MTAVVAFVEGCSVLI